jgi:hypothetical protein
MENLAAFMSLGFAGVRHWKLVMQPATSDVRIVLTKLKENARRTAKFYPIN